MYPNLLMQSTLKRLGPKRALRLTQELKLRMIADALLINIAVLTAEALRFVYQVAFNGPVGAEADLKQILFEHLIRYRNSALALTLVCSIVFYFSGFYTYGRAYQGRYKALVVAHSVSLGYSLFAFLLYFTNWVGLRRGTLLMAWVLSIGLLLAARFWSSLWKNMIRAENTKSRRTSDKIQNVLVIGGAGYIGSALLPKLLDKGYRVRLFDLFLYGSDAINDVIQHPRLEIMKADLRQIDRVVEAMQGMDAVIHLAAIVGDPACALDEDLTVEVNLMATRMIAEVAKGSGVSRFIFASTCSVYGASDEVLDEHSVLNPVSLYARSKIASERVLMSMADSTFAPTLLRFGTIYGLSGRTRFDLVINLLTAKAITEGQITVSGGDQWRPFLHVHDAALAIYKTLEAPISAVRNQTFNVGSDEQNYTIYQVGSIINSLVPAARIIDLGSDGDRRNYRVDFHKIRSTLGFRPEWTVEQGVQQVIAAFDSGRVTDYGDPRFSNVKFLTGNGSYRMVPQNGWAHELLKESSLQPVAAVGD